MYYGLFKIEMLIEKLIYSLKLTSKMKIHNIFYILLLESCNKTNNDNLSASFFIVVKKENK